MSISGQNSYLAENMRRLMDGRSVETLRTQMAEAGYAIGSGTIHRAMKGEAGNRLASLEKLALFFGVTVDQLFQPFERPDPKIDNVEPMSPMAPVPLISWVQAGCWSDVSDPFQPGVADDWLPCPVRHGPRTYALRVRGESMFNPDGRPSYSDGDIIFVDPDRDAKHGDRVIVRLDDQAEATFKQLLVEDGRKLLKALNPEWKPRYIEINGNATMAGVVIGKWVPE